MKLLALCTVALAAGPVCAGVRIQMETFDVEANKTATQEMLVDANRFRVNTDANNSVLFLTDGGRNRMVMLDKARKQYREMDESTMKQMGQQMSGVMAEMQKKLEGMTPEQRAMVEKMMKGGVGNMAKSAPRPRTVYTAKGGGSVNGFACTKYEGMRAGQKVAEVCAANPSVLRLGASEYQVFEKMREFTGGLQDAIANSPFAGASSDFGEMTDRGFEGFPIQVISYRAGKVTSRRELKLAEETSLTNDDFSLGDAKLVTMPGAQ
jgi:hypothetical protein